MGHGFCDTSCRPKAMKLHPTLKTQNCAKAAYCTQVACVNCLAFTAMQAEVHGMHAARNRSSHAWLSHGSCHLWPLILLNPTSHFGVVSLHEPAYLKGTSIPNKHAVTVLRKMCLFPLGSFLAQFRISLRSARKPNKLR